MNHLSDTNLTQTKLLDLLRSVREGSIEIEEAVGQLSQVTAMDDMNPIARLDIGRCQRTGLPEVIYCEGKTPEQISAIAARLIKNDGVTMATRANEEAYHAIANVAAHAVYHREARMVTVGEFPPPRNAQPLLIISAGTSDMAVAEEAAVTASALGNGAERLYDVGVAGIHRLLAHSDRLKDAGVVIVVAGMEGALPSVVAGLVNGPVIAVPTSVGYGASFNGLSALLAMLNSCSPGIAVCNIDNGFGAGCLANNIYSFSSRK